MTLFGHDLPPRPPYEGDATEAQMHALVNVCQGFGQVSGDMAVQVVRAELGITGKLSKAVASQLIEWAKTAPEKTWKVVAHRAGELAGQRGLF